MEVSLWLIALATYLGSGALAFPTPCSPIVRHMDKLSNWAWFWWCPAWGVIGLLAASVIVCLM